MHTKHISLHICYCKVNIIKILFQKCNDKYKNELKYLKNGFIYIKKGSPGFPEEH